jgi:RimJ/RimL family protein N-acetyltransferase
MKITGKNIILRFVEIDDAEFIYNIRQNKKKSAYLSQIDSSVESQKIWIKNYKQKEFDKKEFYFMIESKSNEKLGLVRVYDLKETSFCWGSWIIKDDAPLSTAIESALQIYEFGFYTLGYKNCHFDVRKDNKKVIKFHKKFGAKIISEDKLNYFFIFDIDKYQITKQKYKKYF